jgi:sugar/nucleoside kinase (ribokinase family)
MKQYYVVEDDNSVSVMDGHSHVSDTGESVIDVVKTFPHYSADTRGAGDALKQALALADALNAAPAASPLAS